MEHSTPTRTRPEEHRQLVPQDTSNHDQSREYLELRQFKYVIRCSVLFTCVCVPVFLIGGCILLTLSIVAFAEGENCRAVVAPHALTVFNFLYGLLCLATPGIMIMLTVYFCCENRNSKWDQPFKVMSSKCLVVGTTIAFFLILLILIVTELLYALAYIAPQVYSQYGTRDPSDCKDGVYITTFVLLIFSGILICILLTVLGVYVSVRYFAWVTDPHKPGTLKRIILTILPARTRGTYSISQNTPPTNSA